MQDLPIFLREASVKRILTEAGNLVPPGTRVYLFGGAVRNAIYFDSFREEMEQRDYDCIIIGDGEAFAKNLESAGYIYGSKNSDKSKILKKARIENPVHIYDDWVYLDCKIFSTTQDISKVLANITDFTISGVALDVGEINNPDWRTKIITIPHAIEDIKSKKLRVINAYTSSFYKAIRMISRGFIPPEPSDTRKLIEELYEISEKTFALHKKKTMRYIGEEEKILGLARELGVSFNILNFEDIKSAKAMRM